MLDQITQVTILVGDLRKAVNFYSYVLGLPIILQNNQGAEFRTDGVILAVKPRESTGGSGSTQVTFQVSDLDVAFTDAKGRGAKVLAPPRTVEAGRLARLADPEGNIIELFEPEA
ncbi:MAG TPA: VOC family protein [bacterium]|jgi:predicted enzyme related to lactoylglutathione lyase